jgi:hypothetical protein
LVSLKVQKKKQKMTSIPKELRACYMEIYSKKEQEHFTTLYNKVCAALAKKQFPCNVEIYDSVQGENYMEAHHYSISAVVRMIDLLEEAGYIIHIDQEPMNAIVIKTNECQYDTMTYCQWKRKKLDF